MDEGNWRCEGPMDEGELLREVNWRCEGPVDEGNWRCENSNGLNSIFVKPFQ